MSLKKKWFPKIFIKKSASILASFVLMVATLSTNSICCGPFYEPEQPEELKQLKKDF